jgi:hypothetical protein
MAIVMNGAYFNGLDQTEDFNGLQTALNNIPGSTTTDYMLCSLNVAGVDANGRPSADINYGWNLPCILASGGKVTQWTVDHLVKVVTTGVNQGKCQRVWLTIGGAYDSEKTSAFTNIDAIINNGGALCTELMSNFGAIINALGGYNKVGFDMDYEEGGDIASVVANVTNTLVNNFGSYFTFCPYQGWDAGQQAWIQALQKVYSFVGSQRVVGYNLQTYQGGGGNDPGQWAATLKQATGTGVSNPDTFVWPILSCVPQDTPTYTPDQAISQLKSWNSTGFQSKGASLWATLGLSPQGSNTLTQYSKAIAQGIA